MFAWDMRAVSLSSCWNYTLMGSRFWFLLVVVYLLVLCKRRKFLIHLFSGVAIDLFFIDGSKSRWPSGAWDCPHVQDWQEQIRDNCKELDPEVCNGLMCCYVIDREASFPVTLIVKLSCIDEVACLLWVSQKGDDQLLPSWYTFAALIVCMGNCLQYFEKPVLHILMYQSCILIFKNHVQKPHRMMSCIPPCYIHNSYEWLQSFSFFHCRRCWCPGTGLHLNLKMHHGWFFAWES